MSFVVYAVLWVAQLAVYVFVVWIFVRAIKFAILVAIVSMIIKRLKE